MAGRPNEHEGSTLELDHPSTQSKPESVTAASRRRAHAPRRSRERRRAALSSVGLIGTALAVLFAGGAMFNGASGSPATVNDPQANNVRAVGGAPSYGPATGMHLNANIVDIAATPRGRGYWATASDGGVFTFGDARFLGSTGGAPPFFPITGMAATPDGRGYWLVTMAGQVYAFGDAISRGNAPLPLAALVVGIVAAPGGYRIVDAAGNVFVRTPTKRVARIPILAPLVSAG